MTKTISPDVIFSGNKFLEFFLTFPKDGNLDRWASKGQEVLNYIHDVENNSEYSELDVKYLNKIADFSFNYIFLHMPERYMEIVEWGFKHNDRKLINLLSKLFPDMEMKVVKVD
jgi:hypothetical protein